MSYYQSNLNVINFLKNISDRIDLQITKNHQWKFSDDRTNSIVELVYPKTRIEMQMKNLYFLTMLKYLFIAFLFIHSSAYSASFDCKKARTEIEKTICANESLGNLDIDLDKSYKFLWRNLSEPARKNLRLDQVAWLKAISLNCDVKIKLKEPNNYSTCLQTLYNTRVSYLKESHLNGYFKYPAYGVHKSITIELLDSTIPAAVFLNQTVQKLAGSEMPIGADKEDYEGSTSVKIKSLTPTIFIIHWINNGTHGGGGVSFDQSWTYIDFTSKKILTYDYFFNKNDLISLSREIYKSIIKEADKEALECYNNLNEKSISEAFVKYFSSVYINQKIIGFELDVPRYCKLSTGSVELNLHEFKKYMTNEFKTFIK